VFFHYAFRCCYPSRINVTGWRRQGIWSKTNNASWEYGVCVMEFYRNCSQSPTKQFDLESRRHDVYVQDTGGYLDVWCGACLWYRGTH
jgi:hypothetical protein